MITHADRRQSLQRMRLAVLLPMTPGDQSTRRMASAVLRGGADAIQLREKSAGAGAFLEAARQVRQACDEHGGLLIINDRIEAVLPSGADGVHLGQEDTSVRTARRTVGDEVIIGVSCHSVEEAARAEEEGVDYIAIGCIFPSRTKPHLRPAGPDLISRIARKVRSPLVAIGGIVPDNVAEVFEAGAQAAAVSAAVLDAPDLESATRCLCEALPRP